MIIPPFQCEPTEDHETNAKEKKSADDKILSLTYQLVFFLLIHYFHLYMGQAKKQRCNSANRNLVLLLACLFLLKLAINAQSDTNGFMRANSKPFHTNLQLSKKEKVKVNSYDHVIVKDKRPDKSKMGYVVIDSKTGQQPITFSEKGEEFLNKIFNNSIQPGQNAASAVIILNDIWFNETITEATLAHKLLLGQQKLVSSCYVNADLYKKTETGYISLGRFDSTFTKKGEWLPNNCDKLLERASITLLQACDQTVPQSSGTDLVYTEQEFDSILHSEFNYPILKLSKPKKGIYFSYHNFLNDSPVDVEFTILSERLKTIDYPRRSKKDSVWGYSDGENIYMHIGPGYYKLVRSGQTFEVLGPATVVMMNTFFEKAFHVAGGYFSSPKIPFNYFSAIQGRVLDPTPLFDPNEYVIEYYKYMRLDMNRGYLH